MELRKKEEEEERGVQCWKIEVIVTLRTEKEERVVRYWIKVEIFVLHKTEGGMILIQTRERREVSRSTMETIAVPLWTKDVMVGALMSKAY